MEEIYTKLNKEIHNFFFSKLGFQFNLFTRKIARKFVVIQEIYLNKQILMCGFQLKALHNCFTFTSLEL